MSTRVVLAADDGYAMPLAVSLRSLVDNCTDITSLSGINPGAADV